MSPDLLFALTLLSALGCGLIGGVFYAFSTFVMKALGRIAPAGGVAAMQSINIVVINPWFMGVFLGTALLCLVQAVQSLWRWQEPGAGCRLAGALLYLMGTILVTTVFNVPRNDALARVDPAGAEAAVLWTRYLVTWTAWNHVRTAAALAAAAAFSVALCRT
ncbi:MAG: DUF1772 domain-containing protein [Candidatus Polarisedimenticolia bacterium]